MVVIVGLSVLLAGARHTADRGRDAHRHLALAQRETRWSTATATPPTYFCTTHRN
jgi:hypothetical protein